MKQFKPSVVGVFPHLDCCIAAISALLEYPGSKKRVRAIAAHAVDSFNMVKHPARNQSAFRHRDPCSMPAKRSPPSLLPTVFATASGASPDGLASVLGYQLAQAAVAANAVFMQQVGEVLDLRPVEYTILALVHENSGLSSARLAQLLSVSPPNITVWIDRLVRRGWVQREPSETDRRERLLRVTAAGAQLAVDATRRLVEAEREAFAHLSPGERAILAELLHKLPRMAPAPPQ